MEAPESLPNNQCDGGLPRMRWSRGAEIINSTTRGKTKTPTIRFLFSFPSNTKNAYKAAICQVLGSC